MISFADESAFASSRRTSTHPSYDRSTRRHFLAHCNATQPQLRLRLCPGDSRQSAVRSSRWSSSASGTIASEWVPCA